MTISRVFTLSSVLFGLAVGLWPSGSAHAWGCYPFKCCDEWGYDEPGTYATNSGCEDAGGIVDCGAFMCPNDSFLPWRCCDTDLAEVPGVYSKRHYCKEAGLEVVNLYPGDSPICPNAEAFQCCDPQGGSAPGVYGYRSTCAAAGYVVQDWEPSGCPGGWLETLQETFLSMIRSPLCPILVHKHYNKPKSDSIMKGWKQEYQNAGLVAVNGPFSDKDKHCITSCLITVECGKTASALAGWARETYQMCDGDNNNGWGSGDECANKLGRDYGVSLSAQYASQAEDDCRSYCNGLSDLETTCSPDQGLVQLGLAAAASVVPDTIFGLNNPFAGPWSSLIDACDDGLLGGLTYPDNALALADTIYDIKQEAAQLVAAGAALQVGESGIFDGGSLLQRLDVDEYALMIHIEAGELDAHLTFKAGALTSLRFRGALGDMMTLAAADPVMTSCGTPPCERRVAWTQWELAREPLEPLTTDDEE